VKNVRATGRSPLQGSFALFDFLSFQRYGHALAATDAQRHQPALEVAAPHLVHQRDDEARAGAADGGPGRCRCPAKVTSTMITSSI